MKVKITPYKGEEGALCMPLKSNVPEGREGWELMNCPQCGRECWKNVELVKVAKILNPKLEELCTECALKIGQR